MKDKFFSNWNAWRIVRLVLSVVFVIAGAVNTDYFLVAGGIFILFQAVFNTGCCATGTCSEGSCEVKYKEVKVKSK